MAYAGQVIHNPFTFETITFLRTAANTGGRMLQLECRVAPGGGLKIPAHMHPFQEQRFYIKTGLMALELNRQHRLCRERDKVIILPGQFYNWSNRGGDDLCFVAEYVPAGQWEDIFESTFELARRKAIGQRISLLLGAAVLTTHYKNHLVLAGMPAPLQKMMFGLLALAGRAAGYKSVYRYGMN